MTVIQETKKPAPKDTRTAEEINASYKKNVSKFEAAKLAFEISLAIKAKEF